MEQRVARAIGIYYHSLLFIESDNKALTLPEDSCLYLIACQSLITVVSESENAKTALIPHSPSAYGINQMSERYCHFIRLLIRELLEGCTLYEMSFASVCLLKV